MTRRAAIVAAALISSSLPAHAQFSDNRLRGMSIQIRTSMSVQGLSSRGQYTNPNVRVFKLYISTKGRLFDYTGAGYVDDAGLDRLDSNSRIVAFGERWETGKVGQQWDISPAGLVRTRYYPWGQQIYRVAMSPSLSTCSVRGTMTSTRPDGKFFFYDAHDGQPNEVLSHGVDTGTCRIMHGNVFEADQE